MKYFIIILSISISLDSYSKSLQKTNDDNILEEYEVSFLGALGRLFTKGVKNIDELSPNSIGDDIIKMPSKNSNKFNNFQKKGVVKDKLINKTDNFSWGYNPSYIAMSRGVREIYENDRESYDEMTTWYCPPNIKFKELEYFSSIEERCVAYQMSCNAKIFEQNIENDLIALGSGFFVNPYTLITNNHVITDIDESIIKVLPFTLDHKIEGKIIAYSENDDLAVIMFEEPYNFPSCQIEKITNPKINSDVIAIGSPKDRKFDLTKGIIEKYLTKNFKLPQCENSGCFSIVSDETGEIVGYAETYKKAEKLADKIIDEEGGQYLIDLLRSSYSDTYWIQMNAYITYGSSGGPLYHKGKVVGVNTLKYDGNNMSIHFSKLMNFVSSLNILNFSYNHYNYKKDLKAFIEPLEFSGE